LLSGAGERFVCGDGWPVNRLPGAREGTIQYCDIFDNLDAV
jgi:hypothetical protein